MNKAKVHIYELFFFLVAVLSRTFLWKTDGSFNFRDDCSEALNGWESGGPRDLLVTNGI